MKKLIITSVLLTLFAAGTTLLAQDKPEEYLGLPGDNLNLYAVMKLFQESKTLEEFERNLNDEKSHINNLDQRKDGEAMFARIHPDQYRRSSDNNSGNSSARRSGIKSNNTDLSNGNRVNTTRRSNSTVTNRSSVNLPSDRNTTTSRKSSTTVVNRTATNPAREQKAGTTRVSGQSKTTVMKSSGRKATQKNKTEKTIKKDNKSKESESKDAGRRR